MLEACLQHVVQTRFLHEQSCLVEEVMPAVVQDPEAKEVVWEQAMLLLNWLQTEMPPKLTCLCGSAVACLVEEDLMG